MSCRTGSAFLYLSQAKDKDPLLVNISCQFCREGLLGGVDLYEDERYWVSDMVMNTYMG